MTITADSIRVQFARTGSNPNKHYVVYVDYDREENRARISSIEPVIAGKWYEGYVLSVVAEDELGAFTCAQEILRRKHG